MAPSTPTLRGFVLMLTFLGFVGCDRGKDEALVEEDGTAGSVRVAVVSKAGSGSGSSHLILLDPEQRAEISARYGGQVKAIEVVDQQAVEEGELLIQLADADSRGSYKSARAAVKGAKEQLADRKRELERSKTLAEKGIESDRSVEALESNAVVLRSSISQAKGSYVSAKDRLEAAKITAPFSGVVTRLDAELGEYAAPGTPLLVLSALDSLVVDIPLTEAEMIENERGGLEFEVTVRGEPRDHELLWVSAEADATGSFTARVRLDNTQSGLRAGETAEIEVKAPIRSDALVLDPTAIRWEGEQAYVFAIDDGEVLRRVDIEVFESIGDGVRVEGEVEQGLRVAAAGPSTLVDGDTVRVVEE